MGSRDPYPDQLEQPVGGTVEEGDREVEEPGEPHQGCHRPGADPFGEQDGKGLGYQLAKHDVKHGDDGERHRHGDRMGGQRGERVRQPAEQALGDPGEGRFADPAEPQGGEGDSQLGG